LDLPGALSTTAPPVGSTTWDGSPPAAKPDAPTRGLADCLGGMDLGVTDEHVGRYAAPVRELGQGGIGRVVVTPDRHLGRDVALKELLVDQEDSATSSLPTLARFLREARITGQLEHPNIVPVYELGRRADGSLYYTMRVVRGRTLAKAIEQAKTLSDRLSLLDHFVGLCQALAYAHSRGVTHRDVKPENVMIGEFGETVVLDWGIAKTRGSEVDDESSLIPVIDPLALDLTLEGSLCGTPTHMSPEQALGAIHEVDERSDVWALGVVLYTILCGQTPFSGGTLIELVKNIKAGSRRPIASRDPRIPADLCAIVERALALDRNARYPSAQELLHDIQAFRSGAQVAAYTYSSLELVRRFLQRHRTAAVASGVGLCVVVVLAVAAYVRVTSERDRALAAEHRATVNEQQARSSEHNAKHSLSEVLVEKAQQALNEDDHVSAGLLATEALALTERADARGLVMAAELGLRPRYVRASAGTERCTQLAVSANAELIACARGAVLSLLWPNSPTAPLEWTLAGEVSKLALAADGSAVIVSEQSGRVQVAQLTPGEAVRPTLRSLPGVTSVAVTNNAELAALADAHGNITIWSPRTSEPERQVQFAQTVSSLMFAPGAAALVAGGELGKVGWFSLKSDERREWSAHNGTVRALGFAQQGRYLATGSADRSVRVWDTATGAPASSALSATDAVTSLNWSEDGKLLAFGSKDKSITLLDPKNEETRVKLRHHDEAVSAIGLSSDGRRLLTASTDSGVAEWALAEQPPAVLFDRGNVLAIAPVLGRAELVSAGLGANGVCLWQLTNGQCSTRLPARLERVRVLELSPSAQQLAFAGSGRQVYVWDLPARIPLHVLEASSDEVRALAFSRDGRRLAFAGLDGTLRLADTANFKLVSERSAKAPAQALAALPNSRWLLGARDGSISVWDEASASALQRWQAHDDWVLAVASSGNASLIASAGADRRVRIWNASSGKQLFDLVGHEGKVLTVAFSDDGRWLASGAEDKSVRVWDLSDGRELVRLARHQGAVRSVRFSGDQLISAGDDGAIRLFRLSALSEAPAALRSSIETRHHVRLEGTRVLRSDRP